MALEKGVNSYATVAEAYSYFEDRLDANAWELAEETRKSQALVTATSILDSLNWAGTAMSDSQTLAFPRDGVYFDPRKGIEVSMTPVPERIVKATFELAYHLITNVGLLDSTGNVTDLQVGSISLKELSSPSLIPPIVKRHIQPLLVGGSSRAWWRAN